MFFVGNDIIQSHPDFRTIVWLGATREVLRRPWTIGLSAEYSYVWRAWRSARRLWREARDQTPRESFTRTTF